MIIILTSHGIFPLNKPLTLETVGVCSSLAHGNDVLLSGSYEVMRSIFDSIKKTLANDDGTKPRLIIDLCPEAK